ncbi:MAG: thioredoxin family protein, partial [Planctomycetia bacterium]
RIRAAVLAALVVTASSAAASSAAAGEFNPVLSVGDPAPAWVDLPGVDGKKHSLADLKNPVVVLVFTCNSCPVAVDYEDRVVALAKRFAGADGVVSDDEPILVAVNVNTIPEDALPAMIEKAKTKNFPFVYMYDESQKIGKAYGATFTPEFFVLGRDRKIAYLGGMDDASDPDKVKSRPLDDALAALAKGEKPAVGETVGRGCLVRYNRPKRTKKT